MIILVTSDQHSLVVYTIIITITHSPASPASSNTTQTLINNIQIIKIFMFWLKTIIYICFYFKPPILSSGSLKAFASLRENEIDSETHVQLVTDMLESNRFNSNEREISFSHAWSQQKLLQCSIEWGGADFSCCGMWMVEFFAEENISICLYMTNNGAETMVTQWWTVVSGLGS